MKVHIPIQPILEITALNECMDAKFQYPYYFPGEFHPFWEMIYVLEGEMQAAINENIYAMGRGDLIIYRPMEFHRLWTLKTSNVHAFVVGFSGKGDILSVLESGAYVLTERQQQQLERLLDYLHSFLPEGKRHLIKHMLLKWEENAAKNHIFINELENFLVTLTTDSKILDHKTHSDSVEEQNYCAIVNTLNAHIGSWITTKEIAQKLHCSPAQIDRIFARHSDIGVHKYLLKLKVAAAIRMLQEDIPISEISERLAFSNQNYFSTVFKRETGFPPTRYMRYTTEIVPLY